MWRGAYYSKGYYILLVLIKNTIEYLCLFIKIKCAVKSCAFDFFYTLKEKRCRSPPTVNSLKKNELIGGMENARKCKMFYKNKKRYV